MKRVSETSYTRGIELSTVAAAHEHDLIDVQG